LTRASGFDLRPFLYPSRFPWQFRRIDELASSLPDKSKKELEEMETKKDV
jgi:NAD+ synthase (glutamine-hydrolysing)